MKIQAKNLFASALSVATILLVSLAPTAASAAPPAVVATSDGIKAAYQVLGVQCENNYAKINHTPANRDQRAATFKARAAVLVIFRQALLCNGLYGATGAQQDRFRSGEDGHVTALTQLHTATITAGDPNPGNLPDLSSISMRKQQCK
jgi:hypothetical protein